MPNKAETSALTNLSNSITPKVAGIVAGTSAVSLGNAGTVQSSAHCIAVYESNNGTNFMGLGSMSGGGLMGLGFYSSGTSLPDQLGTGAASARMCMMTNGNIGIGTTAPAYKLHVAGAIVGTSKSFDIDHEAKSGWRLRHYCTESNVRGGALQYT